jgi:pyridoxine 4-dehydrogenase
MKILTSKTTPTFKLGGELEVNRLGYGCMRLTGPGVWGDALDRDLAMGVLVSAVVNGVNFIDTADSYGPHTNEVLVHDALKDYYDNIVIATKGGFERSGPSRWEINGDPEYIANCIEGSLQRLGKKQIQLWQLHRVDPNIPVEETLAPVAEAVKAGKIKFVGLSEVDIDIIERAQKIVPIVSVQNHYNLNERTWEHVIDYTSQNAMAFIPWFPLAAGPDKMKEKLEKIAIAHSATIAQIALAWLLKRSPNIILISGTSSPSHLLENIDAAQLQLTDEEFENLSK